MSLVRLVAYGDLGAGAGALDLVSHRLYTACMTLDEIQQMSVDDIEHVVRAHYEQVLLRIAEDGASELLDIANRTDEASEVLRHDIAALGFACREYVRGIHSGKFEVDLRTV